MIRSRISRNIIVAIFVVFMCFLEIYSIKYLFSSINFNNIGIKIIYLVLLVLFTLVYVIIKDKLYRKKVKRKIALVYRYIYLITIICLSSIYTLKNSVDTSNVILCIYILFNIFIALVIKKIIFNVSKSDILSVLALSAYMMLPNIIQNISLLIYSKVILLTITLFILFLQIFIDELKQIGIKTRKYIVKSIILGILAGISTLLGINMILFIVFAILLIFITNNLDNTHISFPKMIMSSINQSKREKLYGIERINLSKLFIGIIISLVVMYFTNYIGVKLIDNILDKNILTINEQIEEMLINNRNINMNFNFIYSNFMQNVNKFVNFSKTYYFILIAYILLVEVLAFTLKRRYDTKSTGIKAIFILLFLVVSAINIDIIVFQPLFTTMLIIISIVNTSNIYLNREERIKLLVA